MKSVSVGELEMQVMDIVWELKKCSVNDVLQQVNKHRKIAYTTVATILQRLFDKGLLSRNHEKSHHIYSPKLSKAQYSKKVIKNFLNEITDTFGDIALTSFAESIDTLPKDRKEYLLKLLNEYESK